MDRSECLFVGDDEPDNVQVGALEYPARAQLESYCAAGFRASRNSFATGKSMDKALSGVHVLDMTHVQSGPSCTQILAWMGADVIKVELPGRGDITRGQLRDVPNADSLYFTMLNCNKRSLTLNLKSEKGKEIFTALIKRADILVENFGPGVLDRQGFPWERIREINPGISNRKPTRRLRKRWAVR
jgi:hypothetical protein